MCLMLSRSTAQPRSWGWRRRSKRFGALSWPEASALFGQELVVNAVRRKVCAGRATEIGTVLYLLHQGRKLVGMAGAFTPTVAGLMDAACLRQAVQELEQAGFTFDLTARKRSVVYQNNGRQCLALAQHHGYSVAAVRRLYRALIETGEYSEMHLYTYLDPRWSGGVGSAALQTNQQHTARPAPSVPAPTGTPWATIRTGSAERPQLSGQNSRLLSVSTVV